MTSAEMPASFFLTYGLKWLTTILPRLANLADDPPKEELAKLLPYYCQNAD
jgi:hypothetical protein